MNDENSLMSLCNWDHNKVSTNVYGQLGKIRNADRTTVKKKSLKGSGYLHKINETKGIRDRKDKII